MATKLTALVGSIQKFSTEDGPGVRSTVFLKGCPLDCSWCHNPELIRCEQQMIVSPVRCIGCGECVNTCPNSGITVEEEGPRIDWSKCVACGECAEVCYAYAIYPVAREMTVDEVFAKVLQDKEFYRNTGGGVTLSGGEILMYADFASELIDLCAEEEINVCIDTSGYVAYDTIDAIARKSNVEYILYDIKHLDNREHEKYTGVGNEIILDNLRRLASDEDILPKLWMRMPLISGINDNEDVLNRTRELYKELGITKLSIMGYHNFGNSKAEHTGKKMDKFKPPSDERLNEIKSDFESMGMSVEITGREETIM